MQKAIGVRTVTALKPGTISWDDKVTGFYVRRQNGEARIYGLKYRLNGRDRWYKIGRHGAPWTPDTARIEAKRVLGEVAKDRDPAGERMAARKAATIDELCT